VKRAMKTAAVWILIILSSVLVAATPLLFMAGAFVVVGIQNDAPVGELWRAGALVVLPWPILAALWIFLGRWLRTGPAGKVNDETAASQSWNVIRRVLDLL
jgi:hypothetical protein